MILGRPTNLWLGLVTAAVGFISVTLVVGFNADPEAVATIGGAAVGLLGAVITLVASQPPTLNVGDRYTVATSGSDPNVQKIANPYPTPPANG